MNDLNMLLSCSGTKMSDGEGKLTRRRNKQSAVFTHFLTQKSIHLSTCKDMKENALARLRESSPDARASHASLANAFFFMSVEYLCTESLKNACSGFRELSMILP